MWFLEQQTHEPTAALPAFTDETLDQLIDALRSDPKALAAFVERASPEDGRKDGWTPFARRLFLEVLAETGRVSRACEYAQLTKQSAYALRARDPLFAASWDAACELARMPLADALYERALDGVTETITRDGEVVAERHRHDSRLSIAVLHRLDKRCDRALETGANHLPILHRWDEWLTLVGRGEEAAAQALLQSAQHHQLHQLPESENPTGVNFEEDEEAEEDKAEPLNERCWTDDRTGEKTWMTNFPPPAGFDGHEKYKWGRWGYERECTPEEAAILEASAAAAEAEHRAEQEAERDAWFAELREDLESGGCSSPQDAAG
jgi:hypothetical protein